MNTACKRTADRSKSLDLQKKAGKLIPGLSQLLSKRPDQFAPDVWPGYFSKAAGVEVWDLDGNCYVDMSIGGIGANVLGYADPDVDAAVHKAVDSGSSSSLNCPEDVQLAELLCSLHPWAQMVRFARTGGEAMAVAVRLARACTGRDKIAFCGYHGWHDWYLAANLGTEDALGEHLLRGLSPNGVPQGLKGTSLPFRYNRLSELEAIVSEHGADLAAIVMEPIRSEWPDDGFFDGVMKLATQSGALLVIDEISAGFRMNSGGAHLKLGFNPDIAVFSKAIGNGYPIAAVIGREDVMQAAQRTFISSTCWTERIGPTAAIATIEKHLRLNVGEHLMRIGQAVQEGWKQTATRHQLSIKVGGLPPLSHYSFENENANALKAKFVQLMLDEGYLASTSFYAMAAHTDEHVSRYLEAVDRSFGRMSELLNNGELMHSLVGPPAVAGFTRLT
ncbi:MAG: aminotransferase class III-fold pyridoxal phosphate-dependent enzyme [candidate division Zixibacteria bacterium]|nr:aminotransferase class III-fold pyridoxal phosphate-dependent enzyme [candidate division Zixibacteria bacterium]MDH3938049.1 aminotransferase class III-fold pyridoxal phosphate-dependent enzyme [candidate division Zixibacteria bacterium]MDH4033938.1 aminotransferase class III-fold pyridoxal phosphate-dependent enzyme [candidate division Zixibacteria bacterium]